MSKTVYKYVRKLSKNCSISTYIPESFKERANDLEKCAYELRQGTPSCNTKIRWGQGDLILERKLRSNPGEKYRSVTVKDLPPVDLHPNQPVKLPAPTTSPAPGRKKRVRSEDSPSSRCSPVSKSNKPADPSEDTNLNPALSSGEAPKSAPAYRLDTGFFQASEFSSAANTSLSALTPSPIIHRSTPRKLPSVKDF